jgi:hypothetical protein
VIQERETQIKLLILGDKKKVQEQQLESAQKVLSKGDFSSLAVAHAMVRVKNHMLNFNAEILRRDFSVNEVVWDALVDSVYDTAQYFVSQYDFFVLNELDDSASPGA